MIRKQELVDVTGGFRGVNVCVTNTYRFWLALKRVTLHAGYTGGRTEVRHGSTRAREVCDWHQAILPSRA
jgi:hypothetical protein